MQITVENIERLEYGASQHFYKALEATKVNYGDLVTVAPSTGRTEEYYFFKDNVRMREWVGERVVQSLGSYEYTLTNKTWECTIGIDKDDIADNKLSRFVMDFVQQGEACALHPQEMVFSLFPAGFEQLCHTKKPYFSASHPHGSGKGTFSNIIDKGGIMDQGELWFIACCNRVVRPFLKQDREPLTFVTRTDVTHDNVFKIRNFQFGADYRGAYGFTLPELCVAVKGPLTSQNYDEALVRMKSFTSAGNKRLGIKPTHLIHGAKYSREAKTLLHTQRLANGADNPYFNEIKALESPYLL